MAKPRFRDDPNTSTIGRVVLAEEDIAALQEALNAGTERIGRLESRAKFLEERLAQLTRPRTLLTTKEAAAELGVHVETMRKWRKERPSPRIPFIVMEGGDVRYRVEEIERYLNSRTRGMKPALKAA